MLPSAPPCSIIVIASILQPESFVKHVSTDQDHMALVQDMFVHKGPSWRGWVQRWGTVELNHLTLNLSTVAGELRARQIEIGLEVDSAQPPPMLPQPSLEQPTPTARLIHGYPHVPRPPGAPPGREQPTQVRSVAELNHLTLNVSAGELGARWVGLEGDAAQPQPLLPQSQLQQPTEGLIDDYPHTPPPPPGPPPGWPPPTNVEQLCAAMQHVTIASGDQEKQADPQTVLAAAIQ